MCKLMLFLSATTRDALLSDGGESSPLSAATDVQASLGPQRRRVPAGPGKGHLFY